MILGKKYLFLVVLLSNLLGIQHCFAFTVCNQSPYDLILTIKKNEIEDKEKTPKGTKIIENEKFFYVSLSSMATGEIPACKQFSLQYIILGPDNNKDIRWCFEPEFNIETDIFYQKSYDTWNIRLEIIDNKQVELGCCFCNPYLTKEIHGPTVFIDRRIVDLVPDQLDFFYKNLVE